MYISQETLEVETSSRDKNEFECRDYVIGNFCAALNHVQKAYAFLKVPLRMR